MYHQKLGLGSRVPDCLTKNCRRYSGVCLGKFFVGSLPLRSSERWYRPVQAAGSEWAHRYIRMTVILEEETTYVVWSLTMLYITLRLFLEVDWFWPIDISKPLCFECDQFMEEIVQFCYSHHWQVRRKFLTCDVARRSCPVSDSFSERHGDSSGEWAATCARWQVDSWRMLNDYFSGIKHMATENPD